MPMEKVAVVDPLRLRVPPSAEL
jgi:hypothetical protein